MQSVNTANWSYCHYQKDNFRAQITFGADPESILEDRLEYYVTVLRDEINEVFQKKFSGIVEACLYLNQNYREWAFNDQTAEKTGCSTCAAH